MKARPASKQAQALLDQAAAAAEEMERQRVLRDELLIAARDAGATWRQIARALDMSEPGVMKLYKREQDRDAEQ